MPFADRAIELSMLAAYLVVLLWIGVRSARRIKSSGDYTLAGRDVPWVVVLATTAATMNGAGEVQTPTGLSRLVNKMRTKVARRDNAARQEPRPPETLAPAIWYKLSIDEDSV